MPTNLTGSTIASTFDQLLHVDDGPTATEKTVYSGTGVATALKVGTNSVSVDNVQLTGNTVQALSGNLTLGSNIAFGSASNARSALGLGTMATQNSGAVAITGGTVAGITDLAVADGGTGASTAADARTNLGLGTMAVQAASSVAITGGTVAATTVDGGNLKLATNVLSQHQHQRQHHAGPQRHGTGALLGPGGLRHGCGGYGHAGH